MPGASWDTVRRVSMIARDVLQENGLRGYPGTSGSRGMHIPVRIHPDWDFVTVRRAALALAREVERRGEGLATAKWWKEERPAGSVFVDYNQNAKDHTVASAYSVRPVPDARVACGLDWDEVAGCDPADFTVATVPARLRERGDPNADIDLHPGSLDSLLALAEADEERGVPDEAEPSAAREQD
jgi:DNA primase